MGTSVLLPASHSETTIDASADAASPSEIPFEDAAVENQDDLLVEEVRIEDLSIDGMCGVY